MAKLEHHRVFPWRDRALLARLLCFLHGEDVHCLAQTHRACLENILPILQQYKRSAGRLALAIWYSRHLHVEFQSYYQVLDTQRVPRSQSRDPRVPPRVVSYWSERGKVEGGTVALKPSSLPLVHRDGLTAHFTVDANERPMLTSVAQTQRRIYTMVTVKLRQSGEATSNDGTSDGEATTNATVLRQYSYIKEFGEWVAPTPAEKRLYDLQGHAPCRYDLLTRDGSVALELDVPSGADSLVDYYLVKRAVVNIHMGELLQHYFQSLRPPRPLPAPAQPTECVISVGHYFWHVHFRTLQGDQVHGYTIPGRISIERQQNDATTSTSTSSPSTNPTATEHFDIITCKARDDAEKSKIELPKDPGYLWLRIWDSTSKQIYYHAVMLHQGESATRSVASMSTQWLPGILEFFPTLDSRQRRCLKGQLTIASSKFSGELQELTIVAQHIEAARLERYAATMRSYTRMEARHLATSPEHQQHTELTTTNEEYLRVLRDSANDESDFRQAATTIRVLLRGCDWCWLLKRNRKQERQERERCEHEQDHPAGVCHKEQITNA